MLWLEFQKTIDGTSFTVYVTFALYIYFIIDIFKTHYIFIYYIFYDALTYKRFFFFTEFHIIYLLILFFILLFVVFSFIIIIIILDFFHALPTSVLVYVWYILTIFILYEFLWTFINLYSKFGFSHFRSFSLSSKIPT